MKTVLYFYENAFTMWRKRLAGIFAVARVEGWHVEAVDVAELDHGPGPVLDYLRPDGAIVEGGVFRHRRFSVAAFSGMPAVYCDADASQVGPDCFGVSHDSGDAVRKAMRELLALGSADYGFVHYRMRREWSLERERLFRTEVGRARRRARVFVSWERKKGENLADFWSRLAAFVTALPKPCGILAANDEMAAHVLVAAARTGIRVPDEMAVMGVDNDELVCENCQPTLSSVAPAFERSGKLAAGLLARRFARPDLTPVVLKFGSSPLVRRLSTRRTARVDQRAVRALEYVRINACKGIKVADVVREMALKTRTAENRFREVAGRSIRDEIISVRVARAKALLEDPKTAANTVYSKCGYNDERSLRHVFTRATGLSPSAWRVKHANLRVLS